MFWTVSFPLPPAAVWPGGTPEPLARFPVRHTPQTERPGDRREDEVGLRDGGEIDKDHPIGKTLAIPAAASIANRVLPAPPGPVSVSSRTPGSRSSVAHRRDLRAPPDERGQRLRQRRHPRVPERAGQPGRARCRRSGMTLGAGFSVSA